MANVKISNLTAATTPVAGTEVLPIVQSGATVKVSIANLTPGLDTITAAKGGTGQTSYAVGDLLYASTTTALSKLADVATGNALISGGVSTAPSWGKIGLTTHVSGVLPTANGGTNLSSFTANGVVYASSTSALTTGSALVFDGSNLGVGVTPSAWNNIFKAVQINAQGALMATSASMQMGNNVYYDGAYKFIGTGYANRYYQATGQHVWTVSTASGSAGGAITETQAMTLTADGNLGVGTTNPATILNASRDSGLSTGTGTTVALRLSDTGADGGAGTWNTTQQFTAVQFYSADTSSGAGATVRASVGATMESGNGATSALTFFTNASGTNTERARITSGGYFKASNAGSYLGSTSAYHELDSDADNSTVVVRNTNSTFTSDIVQARPTRNTTNGSFKTFSYYNEGAGAFRFQVLDSGNVQNTNNSYGAISDAKLKENIVDTSPKLNDLMQVRVRNFNFKDDQTHKQIGVIAQELEQVFPALVEEFVDRDAEGNDLGTTTKSVKYSVFVPMLIKALQEQQSIIQSLTARITALEGA